MRFGKTLLAVAAAYLASCGEDLQLNLVLYDPCNQRVLPDADTIALTIDAPSLSKPAAVTWDAGAGEGELPEVPRVEGALVDASLRQGGRPGVEIGHGAMGRIDMREGTGGVLSMSLVVSPSGRFSNTTDSKDGAACTGLGTPRFGHTATTLNDGRVLVTGGTKLSSGASSYEDSTELFDTTTGRFSAGPGMAGWRRTGHTATLLKDGTVLVAGGLGLADDAEATWKIAQIFDPKSDTFGPPLFMIEPRVYHTATLLDDGRVLIVGGRGGKEGPDLKTTEIYDPVNGGFLAGPELSTRRAFHAAVLVGQDTVVVAGGRSGNQVVSSTEFVVMGSSPNVVEGPTLGIARSHIAASLIPNTNAVVLAGGFGGVPTSLWLGTGLDTIEFIDVNLGQLSSHRTRCTTLKLASKRGAASAVADALSVVIFGGVSQANTFATDAERITVSDVAACQANVTEVAGALATPRADARVTRLLGGDYLITGGVSVLGGTPASVAPGEVYVPLR